MRIAWICNKIPKPVVQAERTGDTVSGGWLDSTSADLLCLDGVQVLILYLGDGHARGRFGSLSYASFSRDVSSAWFAVELKAFDPDVTHVWGTECPHSLEAVRAAASLGILDSTIVSIQGLVSVYGRYHFTEGLPETVV